MIKVVRGEIAQKWNQYVSREKNPEMMDSEFGVIWLKSQESYELCTKEEYIFCLNEGKNFFSVGREKRNCGEEKLFYRGPLCSSCTSGYPGKDYLSVGYGGDQCGQHSQ